MMHENLLLHAQKTISLISLELIGSSQLNSKEATEISIEERCKEAIKWQNYLKQMDIDYGDMPLAMIEIFDDSNLIAFNYFDYGNLIVIAPKDEFSEMLAPKMNKDQLLPPHSAPDMTGAESRDMVVEKISDKNAIAISSWLSCPVRNKCQHKWLKIRLIYFNLKDECKNEKGDKRFYMNLFHQEYEALKTKYSSKQ